MTIPVTVVMWEVQWSIVNVLDFQALAWVIVFLTLGKTLYSHIAPLHPAV